LSSEFETVYSVGGKLNKINNVQVIDLLKKITYPEALMPEGVNDIKRKGFRIEIPATTDPVVVTYTPDVTGVPTYLNEISVTPTKIEDLDYWEFEVGTDKVLETMYTEEVSDGGIFVDGAEIYRKIPEGTELTFTFYNDSSVEKKVYVTLGFIYENKDL
jgi:hypothetical protein